MFPSCQAWADEVERVLAHALAQNQFYRFLPRLKGTGKQRDETLAEARTSFFLFRLGFTIVDYEPPGAEDTLGEMTIQWRTSRSIFVEVKHPSWRGEVLPTIAAGQGQLPETEFERRKARLQEPKDINGEARWIDPVGQALLVVERSALKKLRIDRSNLVVICDDLLVTPVDIPNLDSAVGRRFCNPLYERLGGILFLKPDLRDTEVNYRVDFVENEHALPSCRLPHEVLLGLKLSSEERRRKHLQRSGGPEIK